MLSFAGWQQFAENKRKVRKQVVVNQKIRSDSGVPAENEVGLLSRVILSKQSINRCAQFVHTS